MNEWKNFGMTKSAPRRCVSSLHVQTLMHVMFEFSGPHDSNIEFPSNVILHTVCGQSEWSDLTWTVKFLKEPPLP